jgi:hypothetical protein
MLRILRLIGLLGALLMISQPGFAQSAADCAAHADRVSRDAASTGAGIGGGALGGAVFGAIVGDSSRSAKRGAVLGGTVGGIRNASRKEDVYKRAYDQCMAGSK